MFKKLLSTDIAALVNTNLSLLILRVGAGLLILTHGWPKLLKAFSGDFSFGDPIGIGAAASLLLAAFAEGICGFLVTLGLGTRLASIVLSINMFVVVFFAHADDPFGTKEKGLLFLLLFVVIALTGGGKYSADKKVFGK
ncbi:MAG TPA: DoxX family protein [Gracilimonas sp.]|uniref:DoxX family protein n=1 Tax=Gracilimonas sp. TaxID=1974203 RepID=UPI002D8D4C8C|nr:DoxX family protein [Gracilimonas sp.]